MTMREDERRSRYIDSMKTTSQRLGWLVEECGEVLAAVGKTQRWGLHSYNPELPTDERETNAEWIMRELKDLEAAIALARAAIRAEVEEHP